MNELTSERQYALKRLLLDGNSLRNSARMVSCAKNTAMRYRKLWEISATCGCGKPAGHQSWCWFRFQFAPTRQGFFDERWKRRGKSDVLQAVAAATVKAKALGHVVHMFVWASGWTSCIAHSKCSVCGATGRVWLEQGVIGPLVERSCVTAKQREQQRKAFQEKKQWLAARKTLREIKRHLRQSPSPKRASTPERSSPA